MDNSGVTQQITISDKTMVTTASGAEATVMGATVTCPVCGAVNPPVERYCGECGFLLESTPGDEIQVVEPAEQPRLMETISQIEHFLRQGENTVGREASDVLLNDPTISRKHAVIVLEDGRCWVEDSGSTNGTYVSGAQIQPQQRTELADGAEVKFGSTALVLKIPVTSEESADAEEVVEDAESFVPDVSDQQEAQLEFVEDQPEEPAQEKPVSWLVHAAQGTEFAVNPGITTIGRRDGNGIVLSGDPYVSGAHAEITADEDGLWIKDVGSTNGSSLNGTRLQPRIRISIKDGDELLLGQTSLRVKMPSEEETVEDPEDQQSQ